MNKKNTDITTPQEFFSFMYPTVKVNTFKISSNNDIYYRPQLPENGKAKTADKDIQLINTFFIDIDEHMSEKLPDFYFKPSCILKRDEKHYHIYWKLKEPKKINSQTRRQYKMIMLGLAYCYGGDKSIINLSRMMRVPGTETTKHGENGKYKGEGFFNEVYSFNDFLIYEKWGVGYDIYETFNKKQTEIYEQRHDTILSKANAFYASGMDKDLIVHFLEKFQNDFCIYDKKEQPYNLSELERWTKDAIFFIDKNGGPKKWKHDSIENINFDEYPLFELNQGGFVERLKHYLEKGDIIYNVSNKSWYRFKGKYWLDNILPVFSVVSTIIEDKLKVEKKIAVMEKREELLKNNVDMKQINKILSGLHQKYDQEIKSAHSTMYKKAVLEQLSEQEGFVATEASIKSNGLPIFNQKHKRFNFANGTYDFTTFEIGPHLKEDLSTVNTNFNYAPEAKAPKFKKFLTEIFEKDEELITWIQTFLGSCMIGGENKNRVFPIFYGGGANGKSTLVDIIVTIFNEYAETIRPEALANRNENTRFELSSLPNKRLVIAHESKDGAFLNVSLVKQMTGNDILKCERKGKDHFDFYPTFKIILITNNKPIITEKTKAIWDRVRLIPFNYTVPDDKIDRSLKEKIIDREIEGVISWLIEGAKLWIANNYSLPKCEKIQIATREYEDSENEDVVLIEWIDEQCESVKDIRDGSSVTHLQENFNTYTKSNWRRTKFSDALLKLGYVKEKFQLVQFNLKLKSELEIEKTPFSDISNP